MADEVSSLADDARAVMAATAAVAGEKVSQARKRLAAALENGKQIYGWVRDKTVQKARVANEQVHEHPYQAMGIAFGVGMLVGILAARHYSRSDRD